MPTKVDNVHDIVKEGVIRDIGDSNKVVSMSDIVPSKRPIEKKDVDQFVKDFKKKHSINSVKNEDKDLESGSAVALALYIRQLKRINSHLMNVASSVVNPFHRIGFKPKKKK